MSVIHNLLVGCSVVLYLLGRICDDMDWYYF
jgi:hypothetical protein